MKKYKLNNNGFAVSVILYAAVTLAVLVLFLIVSILSTSLNNKNLIVDDIKKDVSGIVEKENETLGNITITASDSKQSDEWHTGDFKLTFSAPEKRGEAYNFPIIYYYGTNSQAINKKLPGNELEITGNTSGTTYYIKACKSGDNSLCSSISKYIVKTDKTTPIITVTGDSTEWKPSREFKIVPDSVSGIDYYEYYVTDWEFEPTEEDTVKTTTSNTIKISDPGKFVYIRAVNKVNNKSEWKLYNLYVDPYEPTGMRITASDNKISGEWHQKFSLIVSDASAISGVDYYYSTTSSDKSSINTLIPTKDEVSSIEFATNTSNTPVYIIACNKAKVCTDPTKYIVKVDISVPTVPTISTGISSCTNNWNTSRKVTLTSTSSSISGIAYYEYYVSSSTTKPQADVTDTIKVSTTEFDVNVPGQYIFVRAANNVGTTSAWSAAKYLCNETDSIPTPTITASDNISSGYWHKAYFVLNISNSLNTVPLVYYYGKEIDKITTKMTSNTISHTTVTDNMTYYVKACKSYNLNACSKPAVYVAKMDSKVPTISVASTSTTFAKSRTLTITPTAVSGIERYEYAITNATSIADTDEILVSKSNILNINTSGKYIFIRAINNLDVASTWTRYNLYVDSNIPNPPTITASDKIESNIWHITVPSFKLSNSTSLSAITYYYGFDPNKVTTSGSSIANNNSNLTTNTLGKTIYAKACNQSGLCSDIATYIYKYDKSSMSNVTVTGGDNIWSTGSKEFTLTTVNNTEGKTPFSGWQGYEYYLSNSATAPTSTTKATGTFTNNTITITKPGQYIYFRDSSNAEKKSAWVKANLYIDESTYNAPTITTTDNIASGTWHIAKTDMIITSPVTTIGTTYYYYTVDNINQTKSTETTLSAGKISITVDTNKTYYIRYCRTDSNKTICSPYSSYDMKMNIKVTTVKVAGTSTTWATSRTLTLSADTYSAIEYYEYYLSNSNKIDTDLAEANKVKINGTEVTINETYQYIYFRAKNEAGITSNWTAAQNLYVDNTKPNAPTVTAQDGILSGKWHEKATGLTFSAEKVLSNITYKYGTSEDNIKTTATSIAANNALLSSSIADRKIYVITCNGANLCSDPTIYIYNMDKDTPKAPTVTGSNTEWGVEERSYTVIAPTSVSGIDHYEYYLSQTSTAPTTTTEPTATFKENTITIDTPNTYIFIRAVNKLGKNGAWTSVLNHYVEYSELLSPTITSSDNIGSGDWHISNPTFTITGTDTIGGVNYYYGLDANNIATLATTIKTADITGLKDNTNGVTIYVKACSKKIPSLCSNITQYLYKLDKTNLTAPTITGGSTTWEKTSIGREFTIKPTTTAVSNSGILGYEYYISTSTTAPASSTQATGIISKDNLTPTINKPGLYIYFREVSVAGKKSAWSSYKNLYLDYDEMPQPTIITSDDVNSGSWHTSKFNFEFSAGITTLNTVYYYYTVTNDENKTTSTETSLAASKAKATLTMNKTQNVTFYIKICNNNNKSVCSKYTTYDLKQDIATIKVTPKVVGTAPSTTNWSKTRAFTLTNNSASGTDHYEYVISNNTTVPTEATISDYEIIRLDTNEVTITSTTKYAFFRVIDKAGTISAWTTAQNVFVDSDAIEKPEVVSSDKVTSGNWHVADVTLTATTTSTPISGIIYKYYTSLDTTLKTASGSKITYTTNTVDSPIAYYFVACNNAGVCSEATGYVIRLDKTTLKAPTVTHSVTEWTASPKTYKLTQTDNNDIQKYEYYVSDTNTVPDFSVKPTGITDNMPEVSESGTYVFFRAVKDNGRPGSWTTAQNLFINKAYLDTIEVDGYELEPAFISNNLAYTVKVPYETKHVDVTFRTYYDTTTTNLTNVDELKVGENQIYISCENGTATATYKITVIRENDKTNTLNSITVSDYELEPTFDKDVNDYTVRVPADCTSIDVNIVPVNENETVTGTGSYEIDVSETVISIIVTSANGDVNIYNITIIREN